MTRTKKSDDRGDVTRAYRDGVREQPPARLDAAILAQARKAVAPGARMRMPFGSHWTVSFSLAAVVLLSVGLVLVMDREGVAPWQTPAPRVLAPAETRPPADALRRKQDQIQTATQTGAEAYARLEKRSAIEPAAPATTPAPPSAPKEAQAELPASQIAPLQFRQAKKSDAPAAEKPERADRKLRTEIAGARLSEEAKQNAPAAVAAAKSFAHVMSIRIHGNPGNYLFDVGVRSPDTGCAQYADWWEVLSTDGRLIYRQLLAHSHVDEQPFVRSGGPIAVAPEEIIIVRAHMHPAGYGGAALKGSVQSGFQPAELPGSFAQQLADQPPHADCAF